MSASRRRAEPKRDLERPYDPAPGERNAHLWGYRDTAFEFVDPKTVRVTGGRYPLAGPPLPHFIPFVESVLGMPVGPDRLREPAPRPPLPAPRRNEPFLAQLRTVLSPSQWEEGDEARLSHSHGQLSVDEVYEILQGRVPERIVDLVVFPERHEDVVALVRAADRHGVALVPYGGGTNVSGALRCPADEERTIVSVDMRRMNRILEIDRANGLATVEAGIAGKDLEALLEEEGLTCGHVPDSVEFSTLGGWIATNASGMKRNRYGNIEDIVLEADLVTPRGEVRSRPVVPRSSTGIRPTGFLFGSEGGLGIVTRATLQVRPLPEVRRYASYVFPSFSTGIRFLRDVQDSGVRPASIRLVNNTEFRLGQAMRPPASARQTLLSRLQQAYVVRLKGFDPASTVACTAVMEGTADEVRQQERGLREALRRHGGLSGGPGGGRRGYGVTFAIAYIRDFLNRLGIVGETFETSVPWSRIEAVTGAVERELGRQCAAHGVPGRPYLSYRVSQSYHAGVCIYFTMAFSGRGMDDPVGAFGSIEHRLRQVILDEGGSLSHHHGVGKIRQEFLPRVHSQGAIEALRALKRALDPNDVFAARNGAFGRLVPAGEEPVEGEGSAAAGETP